MKKIFIPVLTLLIACISAPSYSGWGDNFSHNNRSGNNSWFSSDSDGYWLNKLRSYKKYPVSFYSQRLLNKKKGTETKTVETREYQRDVAVVARVGQRMYDSTTYTVTTKTGGEQYIALSNGTLHNTHGDVQIKKNQVFTPIGEVKVNGQYYVLFDVPENEFIIAADYKGYFLDAIGLIEDGNLYVAKDITVVNPKKLRVKPYQSKKTDTTDAELNFEVRYGGIQDNSMAFIILDNDNDQEGQTKLVPLTESLIQIHGVTFEIIHASPDYIEYIIK